ncbi:hypothetical protein MCOR27_007863 [Pyricularia oryzae]|uniref:Uncharacterized protein n=1 Tax=Pyricularia grisea TaxID=148305 RepID=A0ABQ8NQ11_PYRGI|nr:hypothetical protein MCOR01_011481 [Pyricularia oryzae]KAI6300470.1 hypothetical protein MCOR33_003875 [Pyricularia grisea]KAI6262648.1 hypothetical protein MCOR19_001156 [Pyricularia oryzae]KAI6273391.1 hypothetical protein MCOR27_007863 [Pyricularia oryzae]KAI6277209.1 hypothetical protein MCOR26_005282 [Pyricularia oryzae]
MQFSVLHIFTLLALSTSVLGVPTSQHGNSVAQAGSGNAQPIAGAGASAPSPHDAGEACVPCKEGDKAEGGAGGPNKLSTWRKIRNNSRYHVLDKVFFMRYNTDKPKDKAYWDWREDKVKGKSWDGVAMRNHPVYTTHGQTFLCCGGGISMVGGAPVEKGT